MLRRIVFALTMAVISVSPTYGQAPTKMTPFTSLCVSNNGQAGRFLIAGSDTVLLMSVLQAQMVTVIISPDADSNLNVILTRKGGTTTGGTISLTAGQSITLSATELTAKTNFKSGEYCLRARTN